MKPIKYKRLTGVLMLLCLFSYSCYDEYKDTGDTIIRTPGIKEISPFAGNPLGEVQPGEECTVKGISLTEITEITVDDFTAEIISANYSEVKFTIPGGNFPQQSPEDNALPRTLKIFGARDAENPVYQLTIYVKVP
jgi:hypothetical protein